MVKALLHLASLLIFCFILGMVMLIARFYEKKAGERTFYQLYLLPIILFILAGVLYLQRGGSFVGDVAGDLVLALAGAITVALVSYLFNLMMGRRKWSS
ncbi:MAG: hypothetical protein DRI61_01515 [Chloroflexi bacterium]|nr:MAG: hypothetical protein DRI61_01515 [Chloroflexota bacterium]HDN79517.1 hypothetical protein [Chloroflexota bacterium]